MRIRIVFGLKNKGAFVPFHHQFLLAQTIKGLLVAGQDPKFQQFTHYNFSGLKGQTKISRKGLHFYSSRVTLVFSSSDKPFLDYFLGILFDQKEIMIGTLQLVPELVEQEEPVSVSEAVKFLCISPIVVMPAAFNDESGKRFISPESDEFSDLLYETTIHQMQTSGKFTAEQLAEFYKFQLVPDKDYLQRIQSSHKKFARIYPLYDADIKYEVRGYTFPFTLFAPPAVQEFVYEHGLGQFTHKGFGMLDMANHQSVRKAQSREMVYV
ncbi:MAG: CRISPR-associated endoribonuclease Cas6 [Bacteroidetes bacterium]|nr:CRISPR-associated endoribonuclease Cas6 [Bacteroidota bacterium]